MARALLFAVFCLFAMSPAARADLDAASGGLGFGYCPPPVVPSCIDNNAHHPNRTALESCSREVLRFTQTLGAYRACLTRESERAIGTGNAAIARFRCLSQHGTSCR